MSSPTPRQTPRSNDRVYPTKLKQLEIAAVLARRAVFEPRRESPEREPPAEFPDDTVGIALSGGGIRSATFCLGVFQALARRNLLGKIDFLSTVSGGGYFGSFYGAWLNRGRLMEKPKGMVARLLEKPMGWVRKWSGGSESKHTGSTPPQQPAGHFESVRNGLTDPENFEVQWLRRNGRYLAPNGRADALLATAGIIRNWCAIHFVIGAFLLLVFSSIVHLEQAINRYEWASLRFVADSCSPWTIQWSALFWLALAPLAAGVYCGTVYWFVPAKQRNTLTRWLASCLLGLAVVASIAAIDTVGHTLWNEQTAIIDALRNWVVELGGVGAVAMLGLRRLVNWLQSLAGEKKGLKLPVDLLLSAGALLLAIVWFVSFDVAACALAQWTWKSYLAIGGIVLLGSWNFAFVNLSSQANFYGSRLTRAYLGASNPARKEGHERISEMIAGDNIAYADYRPDAVGGPLHIVNVTVNETVDARSGADQPDRKGFNLAVGPIGLSAAARHHAIWVLEQGKASGKIEAIGYTGDFHCFATPRDRVHEVEQLELGQWVGISGAAFTTGLGARTSPALSFLCGFFNVRLGWWWDSGIIPATRYAEGRVAEFFARTFSFLRRPFAVHEHLLREFQARFYGSARKRWYLSDGGHFENTAAYELVRRRLPFIIICDDGCDPARQMEDLANLVRKARLDFDAEITVLNPSGTLPQPLGDYADLTKLDANQRSPKAAVLARVRYSEPGARDSLILLIKPTVTATEPVDILHYQASDTTFPQQTTLDQFYDEAQWESYRKLGELTAYHLFPDAAPGTDLRSQFSKMLSPTDLN